MLKFDFKFQKKYGVWNSYLECNQHNKNAIKVLFCEDIANNYLNDEDKKWKFIQFVLNSQFNDFYSFLSNIDKFSCQNQIRFQMNQHTQDFSPTRKMTAKLFQYVLYKFAKFKNCNKKVKLADGIAHDVTFGNIKIDAKTKNGISKFFNKNFQLTTAYNTQQNNNDADYYCFGVCARKYWEQDNILNFIIAGIIDRNQFYSNARVRQKGQVLCSRDGVPTLDPNGQKMLARKPDYVIYAEMLKPIESVFN